MPEVLNAITERLPEAWLWLVPALQLSSAIVFMIAFAALFSLFQSLILHLYYKLPFWAQFRLVTQKIYHFAPLALLFLIFFLIDAFSGFRLQIDFITGLAGSTLLFAAMEEYLKYLIVPFLTFRRINSIATAMTYCLYVGLAFAFMENIFFLWPEDVRASGFWGFYLFRSLFTTLVHIVSSGILGYFFGRSLFSQALIANYEVERARYDFLKPLQTFFSFTKKTVFQSSAVTQGFFIAAAVHAAFNGLLLSGHPLVASLGIVALHFVIVVLFARQESQLQYGVVGTTAMPSGDFEQLRLKISVLQHLKEIKAKNPLQRVPERKSVPDQGPTT